MKTLGRIPEADRKNLWMYWEIWGRDFLLDLNANSDSGDGSLLESIRKLGFKKSEIIAASELLNSVIDSIIEKCNIDRDKRNGSRRVENSKAVSESNVPARRRQGTGKRRSND